MKAQITLTVSVAKEIIAAAIVERQDVKQAQKSGKILLKGGTTVVAVARRLGLSGLRISGRISPRGTKSSGNQNTIAEHSVLWEKGRVSNIDEEFSKAAASMRAQDVVVIVANAIDAQGYAGILIGSSLGGMPGQGFTGLMAQGCKIIIACGLEKLIYGTIAKACQAAGRESTDWSMGMSCGLVPLIGEIVTEQRALEMLFPVTVTLIASGGIEGAEGAKTFILKGKPEVVREAVEFVLRIIENIDKHPAYGVECKKGSIGCGRHKACAWRKAEGGKLTW